MAQALLQKLVNRVVWNTSEQRATLKNPKSWLSNVLGHSTHSGENVSENSALALQAVYVCNKILSETTASIPFNLLVSKDNRRVSASDHGVYRLIKHQPNPNTNAFDFWSTISLHRNTWGNGYAKISWNYRGDVSRIDIMCPWDVEVKEDSNGEITYRYKGQTLLQREVLHFKTLSKDGKIGLSPILQVKELFGLNQKQIKYISRVLGVKPPGYLSSSEKLDTEQIDQIKDNWNAQTAEDVGTTPFLNGPLTYENVFIAPGEAQYSESQANVERQILSIFRIQPTFAQIYVNSAYNSAEQQDIVFAKHTMSPIVKSIESELNAKLLKSKETASGYYFRANLSALVRGDMKTRESFYRTLSNIGAMTPNQVRELEDWNPYEGGDRYYIQGAMVPTDKVDEYLHKASQKPKKDGSSD